MKRSGPSCSDRARHADHVPHLFIRRRGFVGKRSQADEVEAALSQEVMYLGLEEVAHNMLFDCSISTPVRFRTSELETYMTEVAA